MVFGFIVGILSNWMGLGFAEETERAKVAKMEVGKTEGVERC